MTEPPPLRPPLAPPAPVAATTIERGSNDHDTALQHPSVPDGTPSLATAAAAAPPQVFTSAKASASAFASKLAFGGRKLLSPLAGVTGGGAVAASHKETAPSVPVPSSSSSPPANSSASDARTASLKTSSAALASSVAGANAAVSDAASAVTSSISYLFAGAASAVSSASASAAAGVSSAAPPASSTASPSAATSSSASQQSVAAAMDAAELEQLEAEYRQVTAQQRMQILEDLVQFRRADWTYIKAMHEGTNYWLNVALLRETHVLANLGERATIRRSVQFFYLGLGLGKLMSEVRHAQFFAREGCQLLEELEFYFASATVQSMKLMVATTTPTLHEPLHKMEDDALLEPVQELFRPTIYKWNQRPVFRRLVTPSIPFPLDYREVMLSLCDMLALVYSKLVEDNTCSENVNLFQAIVRFDEKIKKLVIDPVKKEFSVVASTVMTDELAGVRKIFASGGNHRHALPSAVTSNHSDTSTSPVKSQ